MMEFLERHSKKVFYLATILFWLLCLTIIDFYVDLATQRVLEREAGNLQRDMSLIRSRIESSIYEDIYLADSLATVLMINAGNVQTNWKQVASRLVNQSSHIRNVGIAPNNVITHVFPIKGNEKAIGLDFRTRPLQYASVLQAKRSQSVYLDGPLELVQGGEAIIARYPIFMDYPINEKYWGSASVVLNYSKIMEEAQIHTLDSAEIALKRINVSGESIVFMGAESTFDNPQVEMPIYLPNTRWIMVAKSKATKSLHVENVKKLTYLFGYSGALILYLSFVLLYRAYVLAHQASMYDELTHLPNRRFFFKYLKNRISRCKKSGDFALLNIDLDDFKSINDNLGHETGDKVLRHTARELKKLLPKPSFISRVGGDEFLVILNHHVDLNEARALAQQVKQAFLATTIKVENGTIVQKLSIGVATYGVSNETSIKALLASADQDMYQQKSHVRASN